ncbi:GNAT family N-acetyltransferase [Paenibacillus hexagrammi]|uniref:GNAT family N-acetyltransferase n=1 Tax=Paenibacillus hexagrammi TaxID=2908839 RepID=A0ABY3SLL9_9BACL|nr:GNAT family N-acetyltransferase [Paenibacillus sp. YPD9-1]UJF34957.1 GNAT family N-acetyltransferase [Paenibacillus sp. YPD9-1]
MNRMFREYVISSDKSLLQIDAIASFLRRSYWAGERALGTIEKSIENSMCFGVYHEDKQIAFARIVTDYATMYYLADVYVDEQYRGQGIGKALVQEIIHCEELQGLTGLLGTKDAHELYEQFGFERDAARFMRRAAR